jgi:hypothetical protein
MQVNVTKPVGSCKKEELNFPGGLQNCKFIWACLCLILEIRDVQCGGWVQSEHFSVFFADWCKSEDLNDYRRILRICRWLTMTVSKVIWMKYDFGNVALYEDS